MNEPPDLPAMTELGERLEAARRTSGIGSRHGLLRPAYVVPGVLAVLVALTFTPPGRAVTGEIGELIGVGEVGGPPTQPSEVGHFDPATEQVVLATGETADGSAFEIVAFRSDRAIADPEEGAVCVNVEFPASRSTSAGSCYAGALRYGGLCCSGLTVSDQASSVPRVEGEIRPGVTRVEVSYVDDEGSERTSEATIGMITPALAERLGVVHPSGRFIASLPDLAVAGGGDLQGGAAVPRGAAEPIEISTFTESGEHIETETIGSIDRAIDRARQQATQSSAFEEFRDECLRREEGDVQRDDLSPRCRELLDIMSG